jgi:hypothetical protein
MRSPRFWAAVAAACSVSACNSAVAPMANSGASAGAPAATNVRPTAARPLHNTKPWGTGASGYFYGGGGSADSVFFAYCNSKVYLHPPSPGCFLQVPYKNGKRSVLGQYHASDPCVSGSQSYGTCTGALSTLSRLGSTDVDTALSVAGRSSDPTNVWEVSDQVDGFRDIVTVTSSTLPNGTPVRLRETVDLAGSYDFNCSKLGLHVQVVYSMRGQYAGTSGNCGKGGGMASRHIAASKSVTFFTGVGASFSIEPVLSLFLSLTNCTQPKSSGDGCAAWSGGSYEASIRITKAIYRLVPVMPNVTLVTASGESYW